jgi:tetratricopeptide (TPR) repeat protein
MRLLIFIFFFFLCLVSASAQNATRDSIDYYTDKNELIKGLNYAKNKTDHYISTKQFNNLKKTSVKKANIYSKLNENDKAIKALYDAINHIEKNKSSVSTAELYVELGGKYSILRDTLMSFKSYHKGVALSLKSKDTISLKNAYQNLFRLHVLSNLDSSYYYMKKKFTLDKILKSNDGLASSYNNHFAYYSQKNEYEKAKKYLDSCYETSMKTSTNSIKISSLSNLGYYYMVY